MARSSVYDFYKNKDQKEMPLDYLEKNLSTPSIDFSKETLAEQAPDNKDVLEEQSMVPKVDFKKETMAQQMPESNDAKTLLDTGSTALLTFGDPSMKALGLGLQAAGAIAQNAEQQRKNQYQAEVARIKARQDALDRMSQIGQGLKVV
jgi:hypothetical protein